MTFKKIHHKQNPKDFENNIKLPQPFEDFADNHVVTKKIVLNKESNFDDTSFA